MKKLALPALLLAAALPSAPVFADTAPASATASPATAATSPALPSEGFTWRFQPPLGSEWTVRAYSQTKMTEIMPSMKVGETKTPVQRIEVSANQLISMDYDVLKVDADGSLTVRMTYRKITSDTDTKIGGKPLPAAQKQLVDATLKTMMGKIEGAQLTVVLSPRAKVQKVSGMEALFKKMDMGAGGQSNPIAKQFSDKMMTSLFSEDNLGKMFSQTGELPKEPLAIGEGFSYVMDLGKAVPVFSSVYTTSILQSRSGGQATFTVDTSFQASDDSQSLPGTNGSLKVQLPGTMHGVQVVDEATGLPISYQATMRMNGQMEMKGMPQVGDMVIPMWIAMTSRSVMEPRHAAQR